MVRSSEQPLLVTCAIMAAVASLTVAAGVILESHRVRDEGVVLYGSALIAIATALYTARYRVRTIVQAVLFHTTTEIYFSFAYLYRIRMKSGHYLLVKHKADPYFQPVGGVYKVHRCEALDQIFSGLGVMLLASAEQHQVDNLRGKVTGKHVGGICKWFSEQTYRELTPLREFYEELVDTEILDATTFRYIDFRYGGTVWSPVIKMDRGGYGMFIHDVYDLVPTEAQAKALEALQSRGHAKIYCASREEIMRLGHSPMMPTRPVSIARHARNALTMRWS